MKYQILTRVAGQVWCVAEVPTGIPDAYSIAEDVARALSSRGTATVVAEGRVSASFTDGRRDETQMAAGRRWESTAVIPKRQP